MTPIRYLNFDLSIEAAAGDPGRYQARVLDSPAGQAAITFTVPFSLLELENLLLRIGRPRRGVRWIGSPEMTAAQTFGKTLFDTVFSGTVQAAFWRSIDLARQQEQGVRIRLRLENAPALLNLPWEYLYDTTLDRFLCHSTITPLVRFLALPQTAQPLAVQPPLQVLVMIASPRERERLDVDGEWHKVRNALADLEQRGDEAAITLAQEFYAALADSYPVDAALTEARVALFTNGNDIEWGTPVLFMRALDGLLFDMVPMNQATLGVVPEQIQDSYISQQEVDPSPSVPTIEQKAPVSNHSDHLPDIRSIVLNEQLRQLVTRYAAEKYQDEEWVATPQIYITSYFDQPEGMQTPATWLERARKRWLHIIMGTLAGLLLLYGILNGYFSLSEQNQQRARAQATATPMAIEARATIEAKALDLLPVTESLGLQFVYVPAGTFTIASRVDVEHNDEHPTREVPLNAFWIGQTEITNAQFRAFIEAGGYMQEALWTKAGWAWRVENNVTQPVHWDDEIRKPPFWPVVGITWHEAIAFTNWLSQAAGAEVRLPTEAEWERAVCGSNV